MNPMNLLSILKTSPVLERSPEPAVTEATKPAGETLEDVLLDLAKWGRPCVGQYSSTHNGWHCSVEVNVTPVGVKFEAKSDFKQTTPLAAALQCRENLREAVKAIGGAA